MRRTRLRRLGKRGVAAKEALDAVRDAVLARANYACERCGKDCKLELHHRLPRSRGGSHTPDNLAALCRWCHSEIHAHARGWQEWIL